MTTVQTLVTAMERIAPLKYAESWDRVGLLVGDPAAGLDGPVLVTIDLTERVLDEALAMKAGAVVAYHPLIWEPLKRISNETAPQRVLLRAIRAGMAIYSPHTALDAVQGGITDWLCEGLSGSERAGHVVGDCRALTAHAGLEATQEVKIVTFVPRNKAETLRDALASAGAGLIGNYSLCAFMTEGTGTFLGNAASRPAVGDQLAIERVEETRLEMVCSKAALALAIETLVRFHPYEKPAVDVIPLAAVPDRHAGAGRRLQLDHPVSIGELAVRLKAYLGLQSVQVAAPGSLDATVSRVGVCPGAGSSLVAAAHRERAELFVTGEMSHHDVLAANAAGMAVVLAGHTNTERGYMPRLAAKLGAELTGTAVRISTADRDPLTAV